ncbi:muts domain V-domain-containing protein [Multifurca ochricompacta]|uniref:DNA mismatch repair protein n=1 Tax=Multifurca ochricompacta TaxID=376703 RepID=A0AAD4M342_9AGAM|nr:muts domain V-domain-containing protein [Multifurca ochricompacta]
MPPSKPKTQENKDKKKQKSLLGWLSKPPAINVASSSPEQPCTVPALNASLTSSSPSGRDSGFETPSTKRRMTPAANSLVVASAAYTRSSDGGRSIDDTPPTSDPIDVDMSSDEDLPTRDIRFTRAKRKMAIEDSDEGEGGNNDGATHKGRSSAYKPSREPGKANGLAKRARVIPLEDDALMASDDQDGAASTFSQALSRFKKSPKKKDCRARHSGDDDDDFIVPDDSEDDIASRSSHSSKLSSRRSLLSDFEEDEAIPQSMKAKKSAGRAVTQSLKKTPAAGGLAGASSSNFLTAAEQRAQATKVEKKSQEDPFSFLLDIRDKDGIRPGEPGHDPRTLYIPKKIWNDFSPFEKQFWEIKQNHFDTILFFQKGKFFELYEEDARIGHREFDLKLTQRVKMSMVGVPEMSFNFWAAKFLAKGYKVGRVDQSETALGAEMRVAANKSRGKLGDDKQKEKIVRRELNKVYTNGTLVDDELLTDDQAGHCLSIREGDEGEHGNFGICVLDSATSEFNLSAFNDDVCRTRLETLIRQLRPKEIVFTKGNLSVSTVRLLKTILPGTCLWTSLRDVEGFDYARTLNELKALYAADGEESTDDDDYAGIPTAIRDMLGCKCAIEALGSMMWYLRQLNIDEDILTMKNFNVYDPMKKGQGLILDGQSLAHIEVLLNSEGTEEGSLLQLLGRCVTPFGKRLFRIWLCMPLRNVSDINARLDAVEDLLNHPTFEGEFMEVAKGLPDLERIVSRIHAKNCKVKDFLKVLKSFALLSKGLSKLTHACGAFESKTILGLLRLAPDLLPHVKNVESRFEKPEKDNDDLLPVEGKDEAYDEIAKEIHELEKELDTLLKKLGRSVGFPLQYWHSAQGNKDIYLVQVSSNQRDVPDDWIRSGGTKAFSRWTVPALGGTIRQLKEARERRGASIKDFKFRLFAEFDKDRSIWLRAIRVMAELDCLVSLARASNALGEPACRPQLVEGDVAWVDFEELRHPAMALRTKGDFIPNNVRLGGKVGRVALLTGPNMGGKSTVMRMTAAGVIMAQMGMFVPARSARLCPVDAILTRMGAYDNMFSNSSTFKVELDECCKIMRDATPKSFVILDELGRGTSTFDGMAIAGAVLHELATHTLALAFFATHYGSLTDDYSYHPNIRNMHMKTLVDDEKRELVFLYKLIDGIATSSFGTHVANLAGVPIDVVERAEAISKDFASKFKEKIEGKRKRSAYAKLPIDAQADFVYLYKLAVGESDFDFETDVVKRREVLKGLKVAIRSVVD